MGNDRRPDDMVRITTPEDVAAGLLPIFCNKVFSKG